MRKLHLHIIYEHGPDLKPFGVAYIRDILPFSHPVNAEGFRVTYGTDYARADVIIIERMWKPGVTVEQGMQLVEKARQDHAILVYSIDDNLLDLPGISTEARMVVRYFCREANAVIVSTDYLRRRLHSLSQKNFVIPNALDERLFSDHGSWMQPGRNSSPTRIIGFMGTLTHDADLLMALQALRSTLRKYIGRLEIQLIGGITNPSLINAFQGLPIRMLAIEPFEVAYPNFVPWMRKNLNWDIGIAPLENNLFTRGKSDIKFLDYSALGIPGIYSQVPCYEATVQHLHNGYLVENKPSAWSEALSLLLEDKNLRLQMAAKAQQYTISNRTLQHCANQWRKAILELV